MSGLVAFLVGLGFALGLGLGGMTQPARVLGFLDVAGDWDPSLVFVMVGAVDFRYRRRAPELTPGRAYDAALWLSIAAITAFLIYNTASVFAPWLRGSPG